MTAASSGPADAPDGGRAAPRTVLVLVRDVLGAGLMGALIETEGWTATFPFDGERPDAALSRLRPGTVLVDGHHAAARSEAFHDAARALGVHTVLFAPAPAWEELEALASRWEHVTLVAPRAGESLGTLVRDALRRA